MILPLLHILHADDDEEDRFIFRDGVIEVGEDINLLQLNDGLSIIRYLKSVEHPDSLPCVIVSDMKMPYKDGTEVLKIMRSHEQWHRIPVVILSNSSSDYDRNLSLSLGATAFFSKPGSYAEVAKIVRQVMNICNNVQQRKRLRFN